MRGFSPWDNLLQRGNTQTYAISLTSPVDHRFESQSLRSPRSYHLLLDVRLERCRMHHPNPLALALQRISGV